MRPPSSFSSAAAAALAVACAATAVLPTAPLGAQIAPGSTLVFTGNAGATDVGTPGVVLDFDKHVTVAPTGNTGTFASLDQKGGAAGTVENVLVGNGAQLLDTFLRVGGYTFDLSFLPSGTYGQEECYVEPVVGQRCTPYQSAIGDPTDNVGLSPFYVENVASGDPSAPFTAVASFDVMGTVTGPGRTTSDFFGTIATTFVGQSFQEILYTLEQYGLQGVTFTGTFVAGAPVSSASGPGLARAALRGGPAALVSGTVVPEPSTVALLVTGLGLLGAAVRRRRA